MKQNENGFNQKKEQIEKLRNIEDITTLLTESLKILGNPIATFDTSYNLLSYTQGITADDPLWNELTGTGRFSHESVNFFNSENFIGVYAESDTVSFMKSDKLKYERMNGKIFDRDNVQLANAILIACLRPFEEGDAELFEMLCEILSEIFPRSAYYKKIEKVYQETPIDRLINNTESQDKNSVKSDIERFSKNLKPNLYLAAVDIIQYDHTLTHLAYFRDHFRKLQPEYQYYIHLNNIIILISTEHKSLYIERDLGILNNFFRQNDIYAGVSSRFENLSKLKSYYAEAINALNYGLKSRINRNIFDFNNYKAECFLRAVPASAKLVNDTVACICEHDKTHGDTLLDVLHVYLVCGRDLPSSAAALKIKEEELSAKIEKLKELFGIDFYCGDMLCSLLIAIKMRTDDKD